MSRYSSSFSTSVRLATAAAAALALAAPAELTAAPVSYVYYLQTFGDWTVTCGRDESSAPDNCTLSAPPRERRGESQIELGNGHSDNAFVIVRVRGALMPDSPLYLRVDAKPPHQTQPNRFGEGGWAGEEAETIIAELNSGQRVVVRSFSGPPPAPRDAVFMLDHFGEALADFDRRISGKPSNETAQATTPEKPAVAAEANTAPAPSPAPVPAPAPAPTPTPAPPATQAAAQPPAQTPPQAPAQPPADAGAPPAVAAEPRVPEPQADADGGPAAAAGVVIRDQTRIARAMLTSNVVNREPVDDLGATVSLPSTGERSVYFFTEVRGMGGRSITHRWQYAGNTAASVSFPIGSDRWRVYSRKGIAPNQSGSWTVTAVGPDGSELARAAFTAE